MGKRISDEVLWRAIDAYYDNGGNAENAAESLKIHKNTYKRRLRLAEERFNTRLNKAADGRIGGLKTKEKPLPKKGCIKRYILTSAQNNTHLHPGFDNLVAYAEYLDGIRRASCELLVGTYSYNLSAYGRKAVKRGKHKEKNKDDLWYDKRLDPYLCDESTMLAPMLIWCGEQNILPTAINPLTGFAEYNGTKSNIVPHAKIAMDSVPTMAGEYTKFNYSTGTVTQRNYIQKRVGIIAEQRHTYGALLVEIDHNGNWWTRQLHIDDNNDVLDVGPRGKSGVRIRNKKVTEQNVVESIYWGDVHAQELDYWVRDMIWGRNGMMDTLRPKHQCLGDVFSMATRGHHDLLNFHRTYLKHVEGMDNVEDEVQLTADLIREACRPWCKTHIVPSNHDDHLTRWLNEADFRRDPLNAKFFCLLQYQMLDAVDKGDQRFNIMEWAMKRAGVPKDVHFIERDESFVTAGVQNGLHGDLGPNGARGSTVNLRQLGRPINKGHDHRATINGNVYSAGSCATRFVYSQGPQSKSVSHIVTYKNGARAMVTMRFNKWRA